VEHLIELINSEFETAQYESFRNGLWKHKQYNDFWVILQVVGNYDLEKLQEEVFASLEGLRRDFPSSEKSTSMLIVQCVADDVTKDPQRVIADENNVYYFKKYVIQYTEEEWKEANKLLTNDGRSLGELLMQPEVFERVKQDEKSANRLLYTVAHKLPFIMMRAERKPYNPNPTITVDAGLQSLFERIEDFKDMEGRTATDEELAAASVFIDQWINEENDEQHQD